MEFGIRLTEKEYNLLLNFMKENHIKSKGKAIRKCIELATNSESTNDLLLDMNNKLNRIAYRENIQKKFVDFLLEISKDTQIILTTHSPILVKQLMYNEFIKSIVIHNDKTISTISDLKLTYLSSNEINYIAFGLATEEYHNELYEEIKSLNGSNLGIKEFDNQFFVATKNQQKLYPWKNNPNQVSIHTFIRNQIHHRKDNGEAKYDDLKSSIEFMRNCL